MSSQPPSNGSSVMPDNMGKGDSEYPSNELEKDKVLSSTYSLEDYARDLREISESDLWGKLNVVKYDIFYWRGEKKTRTLKWFEYQVLEANKDRLPVIMAEVKRRNLEIPHWIFRE